MKKYGVLLLLVASTGCWAQKDTMNTISIGLELVTHGETCGGGLPRSDDKTVSEDRSHFLFGRNRIHVDYERQGLHAHAVIQNLAVWSTSGNQALNLYEGWVKMTAKNGLFAQVGRVALAYDYITKLTDDIDLDRVEKAIQEPLLPSTRPSRPKPTRSNFRKK